MGSDSSHVSIVDVAAAAGVSKSTASRALLGQPGVSERARSHVGAVADRLGYVKDVRAQALKSGRSRTIAIYVRAVQLAFYGELIAVIQNSLNRQGYQLAITTGGDTTGNALQTVLSLRPEGVIVASGRVSLDEFEANCDVPVVVIGPPTSSDRLSSMVDDGAGIDVLANLIVAGGHQSVSVIDVSPDRSATLSARSKAALESLRSRGIRPGSIPLEVGRDRANPEALRIAAEHSTAIMCPNDPLLVQTWEDLEAMGIRVPEDVSLTGYDGIGALASPVVGLTTWAQPVHEIGEAAAAEIVLRIQSESAPRSHSEFRGRLVRGRTLADIVTLKNAAS